ncbi:hypothetical protein FRC10_008950 [Ceratobasidium sp. 414]|nr:hypothetical protein FRC10_008950 [Ceratobasidium sp. 414]
MNSSASTLRSTTPESVVVDTSIEMCSLGAEVTHLCPPPSAPPHRLQDFEHTNFLPGHPADLLITTRDLTVLLAHQAMLSFASDKLAGLVKFGQSGRALSIHLDEPSGAVRTMLEWIYPHTSMHVGDFDALDTALAISKTYDLGTMHDALRGLLDQSNSPVHVSVDPIRAYSLAIIHGLTSHAREAARLAVGKVDFRKEGLLEEFTKSGVSVECAFRLAQKQFAWECALADVLLRTSVPGDKMVLTEEESQVLVCGECASCAPGREDAEGPLGMVGWQRIWAEKVYERLICTPLDECAYLFRPDYIPRIWREGCERCLVRLMGNQDMLDDWMSRVCRVLNRQWIDIFALVNRDLYRGFRVECTQGPGLKSTALLANDRFIHFAAAYII